jgi:2-keto-4-pentenoate hydratase/2-oxohepta-3-ene-1,7-dioic acid hydratase in catechol pathway
VKLATFTHADDRAQVGVVVGASVFPLPSSWSMRGLIDAGLPQAVKLAEEALRADGIPLADVQLHAPLQPASVRDFVAFEEHVEGVRRAVEGTAGVPDAWYDAPAFYFTNPHAILGPGQDVSFPASSRARDLELEVAAVVGRSGTSLSLEQAGESIFGYTIMNDWSARDVQGREMQVGLGPAKGKDFATTLGPWIVTADELDPYRDADGFLDLMCSVSINGVEVGRDLLSNMGWTFEAMLAYASRDSRVEAGDVLGSGTVGHGGCLAELWGRNAAEDPPALGDGDVVTITVEGIGSLTNTVTTAPPPPALPRVRRRDPAAAREGRQ